MSEDLDLDFINIEIDELNTLISQFSKGDLSAYEYLHIEDEILKGRLTEIEIINTILNKEEDHITDEIDFIPILKKVSLMEAEKTVDKTMRFLYDKVLKFDEVSEELKILKRLHKWV
ncbi:5595_t:CDS:2 [Funneliformis geosporum]|nr:5595_t:CDS:2 [Funneliformis geosporum]